ncbi:MAG: phosphoribosylglycinamide formyltransferase [Ignavibacteria bacterium]|nr:phosphoribosylglycinamide formyltransferase [Ignavibacteria bacterium]
MNIAVLASGGGSNLRAILNAIHRGTIPGKITLVVSNNSTAGALEIARSHNIPAYHCSQLHYPSEEAFADALLRLFEEHGVALIALAGYMKKVPSLIIERYRNRILNIHPALLPAFGGKGMYGIRVHQTVIASGATVSGASVHIVDEEYDRGPIVIQKQVHVYPDDTPESLAERVLTVEHEIYPQAIKAFVEGRVKVEGRKVTVDA